jgi:hypothetical protein
MAESDKGQVEEPKARRGCNAIFLALLAVIVLLALVLGVLLLGCRPPPPPATPAPTPIVVTIDSVRAVAELATVEYRTVAEVRNESVPDDLRQHLGIKEEILLLVYGNVKAGFDLSQLKEEDIWTDGRRVQLHLPAPEILSTEIDFDRTHAVTYRKSIFVTHDVELESGTLKMAKEAINQAAIESGIFDMASQFGQTFFENHLRSLGFTEVQVIVN